MRVALWYFRRRSDSQAHPCALALGFGATWFEARAEAAVAHSVDPSELVLLALDSEWCR